MKRPWAELSKPVFWVSLVLFLTVVLLHYSQYLPSSIFGLDSFLGSASQGIERLLFLIIIILSGMLSGLTAGVIFLVLSVVAMLPLLFLSPGSGVNAIFEVIPVIAAGIGFNLWFEAWRRQAVNRVQAQVRIETVQQELQEYIKTVRENEKRLAVLHSVTTAINQFSNLDSILSTAADKVMEAVSIDGVLIYLIDDDKNELELKQYRGISEEFSHQIDHLQAEEFLKGSMTISGQTKKGNDSSGDRVLTAKTEKNEIIASQFIVLLTAQ